jgi:RNA polymerase sigma-70 factor (ECF subfamily)
LIRSPLVPEFDANTPDGMLIAATLAGEEFAFALLVARYEGALLRAATSRLTQRELAEEAVQETFLCAHRWLATYDSRFSFRTWLWTILLNQCTRQAKREARAIGPGQRSEIRGQIDRPLDQLLARETTEHVQELLSRLPEAQADALRLRFFGELTFPEIAAAMACSEAGAKHRVKAGLLKLGQWMKQGPVAGIESGLGKSDVAGRTPGAGLLPASSKKLGDTL